MVDTLTLNQNQLKAVNWNNGHLLVLAGPRAGKTHVLTLRIARLLTKSLDQFFKVLVLALTLTTNTATKIRKLIHILIPALANRAHITTFHSFANDRLHQHDHHIGLHPNFTIIDQATDRH